jgi:hypothetical protein
MFKILDGREHFYQWDLDRKLIVEDASINQVHFCNKTDDESMVVEVKDEDGKRVADVPNILLQDVWRICVYGYDKNYTKHLERFDIVPRSKPQNYVYTETEVLNFNTLLDRINKVDEDIEEVVQEFLEANPPQVDLSGYATEQYVDDAIAAIDIPETDLSDYYTKKQTDKVVSDAVAAIDIPKTDLSNYYTKAQTDSAIAAAKPNLKPYALKTDIPTVPDVSEFITMEDVEDKGYLTEHQQLKTINGESIVGSGNIIIEGGTESINEVYVGDDEPTDANVEIWIAPNAVGAEYALKSDIPSLDGYAKTTDIPDVSGYALKSEIPDVSGYQTEAQVNALINTALGVIENGTY